MKLATSVIIAAFCASTWAAPAPNPDALAGSGAVEDYVIPIDKRHDAHGAVEDYVIPIDKRGEAVEDYVIAIDKRHGAHGAVEDYVIPIDKK